jgi:paraquat-inducible protein B
VLGDVQKTLTGADRVLAEDSALQNDARDAMREVARAASSLRLLTDYLDERPEALVRGRPEELR